MLFPAPSCQPQRSMFGPLVSRVRADGQVGLILICPMREIRDTDDTEGSRKDTEFYVIIRVLRVPYPRFTCRNSVG